MLSIILLIVSAAINVFAVILGQSSAAMAGVASAIGTNSEQIVYIVITVIEFAALVANVVILYTSDLVYANRKKFWQMSGVCFGLNFIGMTYCLLKFVTLLAKCGV